MRKIFALLIAGMMAFTFAGCHHHHHHHHGNPTPAINRPAPHRPGPSYNAPSYHPGPGPVTRPAPLPPGRYK